MGQIESDQVVAEQEVNVFGQTVQLDESPGQAGAMRAGEGLPGVGPYAGKGADAGVSDADLKIKGEASEPGASVAVQHKRGCSLKSRISRTCEKRHGGGVGHAGVQGVHSMRCQGQPTLH